MIIRKFLPVFIALSVGVFLSVVAEESKYMQEIDEADKAIAAEKWNDAETHLLNALRSEPANPLNTMLMSNLGVVRHRMGNDSLALVVLNIAAEKAPKSVKVLSNRAMVLHSMGRLSEACDDYRRILEVDSTDIDALAKHSALSMLFADLASVRRNVNTLSRVAPDDPRTFTSTASLRIAEGNINGALENYNTLISKWPTALHYQLRANCHLMLQNYNDASADINEAIRLAPDDGELFLFRAHLNRLRFRNDDANADAERAAQLGVDRRMIDNVMRR